VADCSIFDWSGSKLIIEKQQLADIDNHFIILA
jgi:hypothetical protein